MYRGRTWYTPVWPCHSGCLGQKPVRGLDVIEGTSVVEPVEEIGFGVGGLGDVKGDGLEYGGAFVLLRQPDKIEHVNAWDIVKVRGYR